MNRLQCGAPHPDPKRTKDTCATTILVLPKTLLSVSYVGIVKRIPTEPDGKIYAFCPRCGCVNKWVAVTPVPDQGIAPVVAPAATPA
jgi:hypothetical protein